MQTPSLCGNFLTSKRSLIAFTWTITVVLTLVALIGATVVTIQTHARYKRMERYYEEQWQYENQYNYNNGEGERKEDRNKEFENYMRLSQTSSKSMAFVAIYTTTMAIALSLYGSTAIVGFTSLRGVFITPCFSYPVPSKLKVGIFGGAIIFFANLLLVVAVIFGEVTVENWDENGQQDEREPYEVERIATILAVTCIFMSALYAIFAILLFLYHGSEDQGFELDDDDDMTKPLPSIANDPRRENFITIGETIHAA